MAREFVKIDEWEEWVPPLDNERELYQSGQDDALVMELRFLTKEQRDHYQRSADRYRKQGASSSAEVHAMRQMFSENIRNIRNYTVNGAPVTTGEELFEVNGDQAMIIAVTQALMERSSLDRGLAKKLRSGSASTHSRKNRKDNGGVRDATPVLTQTTQATEMATYVYQTESSENSEDVTQNQSESSMTGPGGTT